MVNILLAGTAVGFQNRYPDLEWMCRGYESALPPELTIRVTQEELEEERKKQEEAFSDGYLETVCCYRKAANRLLSRDTFVPQTRLWQRYFGKALRVINGDKPLIRMETQADAPIFRAYGTPWQGKEGMGCNASVPLKALFFLEKSKSPSVAPAEEGQTVDRLFRQMLMPKEAEGMRRLLAMADALVCRVPAYILRCDMSENSVLCAYQAVKGEKENEHTAGL